MAYKKSAFGMNFEEFSLFYEKENNFNNIPDLDISLSRNDEESFMDFLEKGSQLLIEENNDIIKELV